MCEDGCDDFLKHYNSLKDLQSFTKDLIMWVSTIIWVFGIPFVISLNLGAPFLLVLVVWLVCNTFITILVFISLDVL
jgi:hypothetical protein